jgi:hypothetical protein
MKYPRSIIYKYKISGLVYIGRTYRGFVKRQEEHMYNAWYKNGKKYKYNTPLYKIIRKNNITDISNLDAEILETRVPHSQRDVIEQKWMIKFDSVHNGLNKRFNNVNKISSIDWKNMIKPVKIIGNVNKRYYSQYYKNNITNN